MSSRMLGLSVLLRATRADVTPRLATVYGKGGGSEAVEIFIYKKRLMSAGKTVQVVKLVYFMNFL